MEILEFGFNMRVEKTIKDGKIIGKCFVGKSTKPRWYYSFRTEESFLHQCTKTYKGLESSFNDKQERKIEAKKQKEESRKNIKIGTIFRTVFGYSMTINEFFQVTAIKGNKVTVRQIAKETVEETGWLQSNVRCVPNCFIGEPETKLLNNYGGINCGYGSKAYILKNIEDTFYENHCD